MEVLCLFQSLCRATRFFVMNLSLTLQVITIIELSDKNILMVMLSAKIFIANHFFVSCSHYYCNFDMIAFVLLLLLEFLYRDVMSLYLLSVFRCVRDSAGLYSNIVTSLCSNLLMWPRLFYSYKYITLFEVIP